MKNTLLSLIDIYRRYISPLKKPCCRFYPTCSQYAYEAIFKYGAILGCGLAFLRVIKCNPFNKGGIDYLK